MVGVAVTVTVTSGAGPTLVGGAGVPLVAEEPDFS